MDFTTRYTKLNTAQKQAVDTIEGPVMVIAGPGTGKTELLSMRTANILRTTDTLPQNILCLTFTESGAAAMRKRLVSIIGADAHKVAIHTFHSFGAEVINQNREYFYEGADFRAADDLSQLEILHSIFDELNYDNILSSKMNGEYTYLAEAAKNISYIKKSGLSAEELLAILELNDLTMDAVEEDLATAFGSRVTKATLELIAPIVTTLRSLPSEPVVPATIPLVDIMIESLSHALDEARAGNNDTKPITAWRRKWLEKDSSGHTVFKSRKRQNKLRALVQIYSRYIEHMTQANLYDFDDMILNVVHTMEAQADLRFNLQEKYQYIMVDEFQDTNMAQMRILFNLTDNPVNEGRPNILTVGDDDQAIYSFQGADVGNIINFQHLYPSAQLITLTDNYRSAPSILAQARAVITQGEDRLENRIAELNKTLTAHHPDNGTPVEMCEYKTIEDEYTATAKNIAEQIGSGVTPSSIAILARKHSQLEALLPYLARENVLVNYEHRDNVLELDVIKHVTLLSRIIVALYEQRLDDASNLLPELISHPAWGYDTEAIWKLSLSAYTNRRSWIETIATIPTFAPLHEWLLSMAIRTPHTPLERMLDVLIGEEDPTGEDFSSPLRAYYFSKEQLQDNPDLYLEYLDALRTIRTKLREYCQGKTPHLQVFLEYIDLHEQFGRSITSSRPASEAIDDAIYLMSAHSSKGLEFDHVYIVNAYEKNWGKSASVASSKISYPENLPLLPNANTADERLRLFFVAMTRAKQQLHISYSTVDHTGKESLIAGFLLGDSLPVQVVDTAHTIEHLVDTAQLDWQAPLYRLPTGTMKQLLAPTLERYRLSITHINNFVDVSRGGPHHFLLNNLLHFPTSMSPNAAYGTAIHTALQRTHAHLTATGKYRPLEDILHDFEKALAEQHLSDDDFQTYLQKGSDSLQAFLAEHYQSFSQSQKTELDFNSQQAVLGNAHLTGKLDLVDIDTKNKTIAVTDYKTGKPSHSWKGSADYEKIKLHKYKQQLMFYKLLIELSRDYSHLSFEKGVLQFVEPDSSGQIVALEATFTDEEYETFKQLVLAVWHKIISLDLPDTSQFSQDYKGMLEFEQYLLDDMS